MFWNKRSKEVEELNAKVDRLTERLIDNKVKINKLEAYESLSKKRGEKIIYKCNYYVVKDYFYKYYYEDGSSEVGYVMVNTRTGQEYLFTHDYLLENGSI